MFFTSAIQAQKGPGITMHWNVAAELPATNGMQPALGIAGAVAGWHQERLIIAGGANFPNEMPWEGGRKKFYDALYVYKPDGDSLCIKSRNLKLPIPLAYAASCSAKKGIVAVGGENEKGIHDNAWLLQWSEKNNSVIIDTLPSFPYAVTNAAAATDGTHVYIAGGETKDAVSNQFWVLDLEHLAAGWKQLPSMPNPVSHAVLLMEQDGRSKRIYIAGGRKRNPGEVSEFYADLFEYDLDRGSWIARKPMPYPLSAGTGLATVGGNILLFGGDKGKTFRETEKLIAAIGAEKNAIKRQALLEQKARLQSKHPGFSNTVLRYEVFSDRWAIIGKVPFDVPVTTTAVQYNGRVWICSGEIKAGVRTPYVLQGKINSSK